METNNMKTFAVLIAFAIAMITIENLPTDIAGIIGFILIISTLTGLIALIIAIGKNQN